MRTTDFSQWPTTEGRKPIGTARSSAGELRSERWIARAEQEGEAAERCGALRKSLPVTLPRGSHPFPSRTRKLSPAGPMVLHGKLCGSVGRRRHKNQSPRRETWAFVFVPVPFAERAQAR